MQPIERHLTRTAGLALAWLLLACDAAPRPAASAGEKLYAGACASCHGADRLGLLAPPLIPQTLRHYDERELIDLVRDGRSGTRMPPMGLTLSPAQIAAVTAHIRRPARVAWSAEQVRASARRWKLPAVASRPSRADLTAVVERGPGNILFIEEQQLVGQLFFPNVHGGLKYHGDKLFIPSRTGFLLAVDLATLAPERSVRCGIYLRNIEIAGDRIYAACSLPPSLLVFDLQLRLLRRIALEDAPTSVIRHGAGRLLVTFHDRAELLVVERGKIARRVRVSAPYRQVTTHGELVLGTSGKQVFLTDLRSPEVRIEDAAMPHIAAGEFWRDGPALIWATPKIDRDGVTVYRIEGRRIHKLREIAARALRVKGHASTFVRTHPALDVFATTTGSDVVIASKKELSVRRRLTPAPGKMALHTEFSRDGSLLFVSVWDERGGIYLYSTRDWSLRQVIPASRPAGQYNRFTQSWRSSRRH